MSKKNVILVLDSSGSMQSRRADTIKNYNEYLETLPNTDGVGVRCYTFSGKVALAAVNREPLTVETYNPLGSTALFDAVAQAIYSVPQGETALIVIISDGEENSSRFQKGDGLAALIADRKAAGFEFIFVGCDQSCIKDAAKLQTIYYDYQPSTWVQPRQPWTIGMPVVKSHEIYCSTQNYLAPSQKADSNG